MYTFESPYVSSPDEAITIVASLELKPGTEARVEALLSSVIPKNLSEEGCIDFNFFRVQGKTGHYVLLERWRSQPALSWHMEQPYTQEVFALFEETLAFPMAEVFDHVKFVEEILPA